MKQPRAWYAGEMQKVDSIDFIFEVVCVYATFDEIEVSFDEVTLMQNTGMKDKNGKDIYEGDIVEVFDDFFEVKYRFHRGYVIVKHEEEYSLYFSSKYSVVKGNIYENKELLEDEI